MDFSRRNTILLAINELVASDAKGISSQNHLLEKCCQIIMHNQEYCLIWAGRRDDNDGTALSPLVALTLANISNEQCMYLVEQVIADMHESHPAAQALLSGKHVICQDVLQEIDSKALRDIAQKTGFKSCSSWPLTYKEKEFGVLSIHSAKINYFTEEEVSFLKTVIADISLALYSQAMAQSMQVERDFNREIVDTMQALLVSVSPCGQILSFNHKAEEITGYKEEEVLDLYWVDVLMDPEHRTANQQLLANLLKGTELQINFESCLLTKDNQNRTISWHGSFRQNIDQGKVGLVLFGMDITGQIQAGQDLNQAIAKWENIFSAIQDPALIVSIDGIILDANLATFTSARKNRSDIIGHDVCEILHEGRRSGATCPLEQQLKTRESRIIETELSGLHGNYLLTISPLQQLENDIEATLLVARNLSEEERMKAEAIRAAQLASLGELAAGVAHEINNPINGIINYAQIILDDPGDPDNQDILKRIIKEGKRVAGIVYNLLDFSRQNSEELENVSIHKIVQSCLELVGHQFRKDQTLLEFHWQTRLANVRCNAQQVQQVLLNILSNARYALNKRFQKKHPLKKIFISSRKVEIDDKTYIRLTITDNGIGIEQDIINRVFDPFYSTKPKGEGTGLGLSISHGLIHDNKGYLRIKSEFGSFTSIIVDLPSSDY